MKILLQGPPKIGKTTVATRLAERLLASGVRLGGFVTREVRIHDRRVGFTVRDFSGVEAVLAHEDFSTGVTVGRYGVDVPAFERVALPALTGAVDTDVVIIDEIARMELASSAFVKALFETLDRDPSILATMHACPHPVTDMVLRRPDVDLIRVTTENRDLLPEVLRARLTIR